MYVVDKESLPLDTVTGLFKLSDSIKGSTKNFFKNTVK